MLRIPYSFSTLFSFKDFKIILAFFWAFFLSAGVLLGAFNAPYISGLYLDAALAPVSTIVIVIFYFLFLVSAALLVQTRFRCGFVFLLSVRGFYYGFLTGALFFGFGSSGWLICFLINGANVFFAVLELWLCFSIVDSNRFTRSFIKAIVISFGALCADRFFFSLLLSKIIIYYR